MGVAGWWVCVHACDADGWPGGAECAGEAAPRRTRRQESRVKIMDDGERPVDIQYFAESGTWRKPRGAVAVDAVLCGGGGGGGLRPGKDGELTVDRFRADQLPDEIAVEVGMGGRPGGRDGYVLVVTHLALMTERATVGDDDE